MMNFAERNSALLLGNVFLGLSLLCGGTFDRKDKIEMFVWRKE